MVGFGSSGEAAARLLLRKGATVLAIDQSNDIPMKRRAKRKKNAGITTQFGLSFSLRPFRLSSVDEPVF